MTASLNMMLEGHVIVNPLLTFSHAGRGHDNTLASHFSLDWWFCDAASNPRADRFFAFGIDSARGRIQFNGTGTSPSCACVFSTLSPAARMFFVS